MSLSIGVCHYCGKIGPLTRDHKLPKRERLLLGWQKRHYPTVGACPGCNQRKGEQSYEGFRAWLLSEEGYWYVWSRQFGGLSGRRLVLRGCEVPEIPGLVIQASSPDGEERHFCASHKPCGVLRRRILVLGDSDRSVWDGKMAIDEPRVLTIQDWQTFTRQRNGETRRSRQERRAAKRARKAARRNERMEGT